MATERGTEDFVLLHGFTHTSASWDPVIGVLGGQHVLAPDIRGHGSASASCPVTLGAVIEDVASLAPERFALAGYSMGGRIALHLAFAVPERVAQLILIGASPGIADPRERQARRESDERLASEFEQLSIERLADRWDEVTSRPAAGSDAVLAGQPTSVREQARADRLRNTADGLARALRGLGTGALPSLWGRLPELTRPVQLVVGEHDRKFIAIAEQMSSRLPNARLAIVPGAGHAVHLEAPELTAELIAKRPR
jgi:2-succinyl-6-hydroxy-2,4-cyclohexadiene-1-carboxylate synthase